MPPGMPLRKGKKYLLGANSILLRLPPQQDIVRQVTEYTTIIASCTKKYYYECITYTR